MTTAVLDKYEIQKHCFLWREIGLHWHVNGKKPHLSVKFACKSPHFKGEQIF